jgi:hypothetical protein
MQNSVAQCSILSIVFFNVAEADARRFLPPVLSLVSVLDTTLMLLCDGLHGILNSVDLQSSKY